MIFLAEKEVSVTLGREASMTLDHGEGEDMEISYAHLEAKVTH